MNRLYLVGLSLCAALLLTTLVLFGYQQQAAAQITPPTETEQTEADEVEVDEAETDEIEEIEETGVIEVIEAELESTGIPTAAIEIDGEIVEIARVRLDGQMVLSVTVRVGDELTVTTPITLDVASWIADLEGSTAMTAGVSVGDSATRFVPGITSTLFSAVTPTVDAATVTTPTVTAPTAITPEVTTPEITATVDVTITQLITPLLSLVELIDEEIDEEEIDDEEEPVLRGEVLAGANLRAGPSTDTQIVGAAQPGDIVVIVDTNAAGDWYNLEGGEWIAGFLVQLIEPEDTLPEEALEATEDAELDEELPIEDVDETELDETELDETADEAAEEEAEEAVDDGADTTTDETPVLMPTATPMPEGENGNSGNNAGAGLDSGGNVAASNVDASNTAAGNAANATADMEDAAFEYRVAVITGLLNLANGVEAMGQLMEDPQMLSVGWNDRMKDQAAVIRGSYQEISVLSPPDDAAAFHADLLSALNDCDVAMDLLTNGLDSLDMAALDQAATLMIQCGGKMEAVISDYPELLE